MPRETHGLVLDAGVFIQIERRERRTAKLLDEAIRARTPLVTSAGVVAQVWRRGDRQQAPVAALLSRTRIVSIDDATARVVGRLLARSGTSDPIDAHVVLLALEREWPVLTSDPDDLLAIDPALAIERV